MKVKDLYDHIVKHMTPEQALMKLLESSLVSYEKLKFEKEEEKVHPEMIIAMATMDLGWMISVEKDPPGDMVRGMIIGTKEYMDTVILNNATTKERETSPEGGDAGEKEEKRETLDPGV